MVALYFATSDSNQKAKFFSVYALKIQESDFPIKINGKSELVKNIRAERQEGLFTYFTKPCSFYLQFGEFPSINHYDRRYKNGLEPSMFTLKEFQIERTPNNINYLSAILKEAGLDEEYLLPKSSIIVA